jgi:chromosome partitioning protein
MSRVFAIANAKGGVGKTTTTVNLSAALVECGCRVLAVDLDPQASLTDALGVRQTPLPKTIRYALDQDAVPLFSLVLSTRENIDLIPSEHALDQTAHELENKSGGLFAIRGVIESIRDRYDYILLDCPANMGLLTRAALIAADEIVIPLTPDYLSFKSLNWVLESIKQIRETANPTLKVAGVLYSMADFRTHHARQVVSLLQGAYGAEIPFFATVIRQSVYIKEAAAVGKTVLHHAPVSAGARSFRALAQEIQEGIRKAPDNELYFTLSDAQAAMEQKDFQSAYAAFCRASEINPQLMDAWIGRAESAPEWDESIRCYARVLQLEPLHPARVRLEKILNEQMSVATSVDIPRILTSAHFLAQIGQNVFAEMIYRRVTELDPQHEEAWLGHARTARNPKDAVASAERCLAIDPDSQSGQIALTAAKDRLKAEARRLIEEGSGLESAGQHAHAHAAFREAVDLDPANELGWLGCARTAADFSAAADFARQALERNPRNPEARELYSLLPKVPSPTPQASGAISLRRLLFVLLMLVVIVGLVLILVLALR